GMKFELKTKVTGVEKAADGVIKVHTEAAKGGDVKTAEADVVLVCVGRRTFFDNLGLEAVGVKVERNKILIDDHWRTNDCDLEPWLQEEKGTDKGYHVLCLQGDGQIQVHVNGLSSKAVPEARVVTLPVDSELPERLEAELKIKDSFSFVPRASPTGQGRWTGGKLRWPKQSWGLFTEKGERLKLDDLLHARLLFHAGVVLLFEGGTWRWPGVRVGYERPLLPGVLLRTVALRPALFEFVFDGGAERFDAASGARGLGPELLKDVVRLAEPRLKRSLTEGEASSIRTSEQAWMSYGAKPDFQRLKDLTEEALRIPRNYFEQDLQVLRYLKGQLYDAHRDYWDPREFPDTERFLHPQSGTWNMRHATVLWFLQSPEAGGDTWFPRAHGGPVPVGEWTACDDRGVKMGGRNGTIAILFYSLYSNGLIDEFSWHCGCPVQEGVKWAANSWVWNQPQGTPPFVTRRPKRKSPKGRSEL
ncbi:unnamed protein product, partial [Polarella glacialis]